MIPFVYFGSSQFSVFVLEELAARGFLPALIISTPDKPQGRKLLMTPTAVSAWAKSHTIPLLTPPKLTPENIAEIAKHAREAKAELYIVASYGKIIPQALLDLPRHKVLNIHPSLLPKYRGPSPLQSMILADDKQTGTSIMRLDAEMDHGPLLGQAPVAITEWPTLLELKKVMAHASVELLTNIIPSWIDGTLVEQPQDHSLATYTHKITKTDGEIDLTADPYLNFRKIQAYSGWPSTYFFVARKGDTTNTKVRVKITAARFENGTLIIDRVIPEGKSEINYSDL